MIKKTIKKKEKILTQIFKGYEDILNSISSKIKYTQANFKEKLSTNLYPKATLVAIDLTKKLPSTVQIKIL